MANPNCISLDISIFENPKILQIFSQKEIKNKASEIVLIWIKILCLSGKLNNAGKLQKGDVIYNEEMIAKEIKSPLKLTKTALLMFKTLEMIDIENGVIFFPNWEKYQYDEAKAMREATRKRVQKCRAKKKECNVTVTLHVTQERTEKENKEKESILSPHTPFLFKEKEIKEKEKREAIYINARGNAYGEFRNVLLTDSEYQKLKDEYQDFSERIERLSCYIESKGVMYENHYATIKLWAMNDNKKPEESRGSFDTDEFFEAALRRSYEVIDA